MQMDTEEPRAVLSLRVHPRAKRDEVVGWREGVLRVRVTAPPVKGQANQAVVKLLAQALGVKRGEVRLVKGEKSRDKLVEVTGLSEDAVHRRLSASG